MSAQLDLRDWAGTCRALLAALDGPGLQVPTSGSTGTPKTVALSGTALHASAAATSERLGGPGQWLLALPHQHVAGLQVLVRSAIAGTRPVLLDESGPFAAGTFARAATELEGQRRYVSLVPTQLVRLLRDQAGVAALRTMDAVLVGGAALNSTDAARAREAGVRLVTTYGMTETAGGCVYDGHPLAGVQLRTGADQRLQISGPVLAQGYADDPVSTGQHFVTERGRRWFVTNDLGALTPDGRVSVTGRADDVVVTGGLKVHPHQVETAMRTLPGIQDVIVVGVQDPEWGHVVAALVTGTPVTTQQLRVALREQLPTHALPRVVAHTDVLPTLSSGKPDRARARTLLQCRHARMSH